MNLGRALTSKVGVALLGAAALLVLAAFAGTAQSSGGTTAKAATVTLLVWDQEVRGGQNATMKRLNSSFQATHPNIKINRVAKSFTDLQATLKLAASGPNPPDVVEANNGYSAMGPLVKANLLMSLDAYSNRYHWRKRYSAGILRMNKFSSDAKNFGTGHLYGLPMTGEVVGVYYNKAKLRAIGSPVPATFAAFQAVLAKAKDAGEIPIQFGNLDKWPGIHEYEELMLQNVSKTYARSFIFGAGGGRTSFKSGGTTAAAAKLQSWAKAGYFTDGFSGVGYDPSWKSFGKGDGVFQISGSWLTADLKKALGKNVGFFLLPPPRGRALSTLGGEGLPWAISTKSRNADAAATYLDYITNAKSQQVAANNGQLTATKYRVHVPAGLDTEVYKQWVRANAKDAIVPYLDWATPTMYDTSTAKIQELLASKTSPSSFVAAIQSDYAKFHHG